PTILPPRAYRPHRSSTVKNTRTDHSGQLGWDNIDILSNICKYCSMNHKD
ncbi:hypothetical protein MPH_14223, partial [Macrophomina phaseolina MS6]